MCVLLFFVCLLNILLTDLCVCCCFVFVCLLNILLTGVCVCVWQKHMFDVGILNVLESIV